MALGYCCQWITEYVFCTCARKTMTITDPAHFKNSTNVRTVLADQGMVGRYYTSRSTSCDRYLGYNSQCEYISCQNLTNQVCCNFGQKLTGLVRRHTSSSTLVTCEVKWCFIGLSCFWSNDLSVPFLGIYSSSWSCIFKVFFYSISSYIFLINWLWCHLVNCIRLEALLMSFELWVALDVRHFCKCLIIYDFTVNDLQWLQRKKEICI